MTAEQLTSSSPIESTESELVQTKDTHSADENEDSGVDEQDPVTSSDEVESNEKIEEIVETESEQTIDSTANETTPIVDAVPDAPVKPTVVADTSDIDDAIRYKNLKIMYGGRDILDFCANIANKSWYIQYTYLPEMNISMCLANRSQYNRLSTSWDAKEPKMDTCRKCSFQYPEFQCSTGNKTTATDAINSIVLNDNNMRASPMFNGNQQKSLNMYNSANNNGYQSMYPNQYSAMNTTAMSAPTSKQTNYGFQYNNNSNSNPNGFMNTFNQSTNANNNNMMNNKQLYAMYRQNLNANNSNNANNYGKMPYKMYSHFYWNQKNQSIKPDTDDIHERTDKKK